MEVEPCLGTTKAGERCSRQPSRKAADNPEYCWQHQNCKEAVSASKPVVKLSSPIKIGSTVKPENKYFKHDLKYYGKKTKTLGSGSYGAVHEYTDSRGHKYAIKSYKEQDDGISMTTTRELSIMTYLSQFGNPNIVEVLDLIHDPKTKKFYLVLPLADQGDLKTYLKDEGNNLTPTQKKKIMYQLLSALNFMHQHNIMNRDVKPANVLVFNSNTETDGTPRVALADFGLARNNICVVTGITEEVMTLWYRPPEIILECPYTEKGDIWSMGCVFMEMLMGKHFLQGDSAIDQLYKIIGVFGSQDIKRYIDDPYNKCKGRSMLNLKKVWPSTWDTYMENYEPDLQDLLTGLLRVDPNERLTAAEALQSSYFDDIRVNQLEPIDCDKRLLNTLVEIKPMVETTINKKTGKPDKTGINMKMRALLLDWLRTVHIKFGLKPSTLFTTYNIIDLILSDPNHGIERSKLQLLGVSAVMVASYMDEIYAPVVRDFVVVCDNAYTREDIITMIEVIVAKLIKQLAMSTAYDLMTEYNNLSNLIPQIPAVNAAGVHILHIMYLLGLDSKMPQQELAATAAYFSNVASNSMTDFDDLTEITGGNFNKELKLDLTEIKDLPTVTALPLNLKGMFKTSALLYKKLEWSI